MGPEVAYIFAIVFIVLAINIFFITSRLRRSGDKRKRITRAAADEAKQALWRDKEIARRIAREQEDALERVLLKNETLALYEEVKRRHAKEDEMERLGLRVDRSDEESASDDVGLHAVGASVEEPVSADKEPRVELIDFEDATLEESLHIGWGSHYSSDYDKDSDPFDIFKKKKKK